MMTALEKRYKCDIEWLTIETRPEEIPRSSTAECKSSVCKTFKNQRSALINSICLWRSEVAQILSKIDVRYAQWHMSLSIAANKSIEKSNFSQ